MKTIQKLNYKPGIKEIKELLLILFNVISVVIFLKNVLYSTEMNIQLDKGETVH